MVHPFIPALIAGGLAFVGSNLVDRARALFTPRGTPCDKARKSSVVWQYQRVTRPRADGREGAKDEWFQLPHDKTC